MAISGLGTSSALSVNSLISLRSRLNDLERQLGSGKKSIDYAGLGIDRGLSVGLRARMTAIKTYKDTITNVDVRLKLAQSALTRISSITRSVKSVTQMSPFEIDGSGQTNAQRSAQTQLDEIFSLLNTRAGDRYLFSGRAVDTPATDTYARIMNGDLTRAGFKQVMTERRDADLGVTGLGRVVVPPLPPNVPAQFVGTGATIAPDAAASVTGSTNIAALVSVGGTLQFNGTPIAIPPGANAAAVEAAIDAQTGVTGVSAAIVANQLVLTSSNADTAIDIGAGSTPAILTELGLNLGLTNPTNLLTQGAAAAGQTLTVTIGANPTLTVTFGNNVGEVSTLAELNAALGTIVGGTASVNLVNGNISVAATSTTDLIVVGGTANAATFGIQSLTTGPTNTVTLSEDVAGHPFGFKLAGVTTNMTGAIAAGPAGAPASITVNLTQNPTNGQTVRFSFTLPDGSTEDLTLTASTAALPGPQQFAIGASPAATAANLQGLLTSEIGKLARTSLTAASGIAASRNFFDINTGQPPLRVAGPPFNTATALVAGTAANTVFWYTGEMGTDPARGTAVARVDESISVSYGIRANEQPLRWAVEHIAVFASMTFGPGDPDGQNRFLELNERLGPTLDFPASVQSIEDIETELAGAHTVIAAGRERHQQNAAMVEGLLDSVEGVTQEEVGAKILALQTRLQASLQTTAMLFRTSIIDYL